jgi:hypothetical protein
LLSFCSCCCSSTDRLMGPACLPAVLA